MSYEQAMKYFPPDKKPSREEWEVKIKELEELGLDELPDPAAGIQEQFLLALELKELERKRNNQELANYIASALINQVKQADPELPVPVTPWLASPPGKRERDRIIWERRGGRYTWEQVAELANCPVSTAKAVYNRLKKRLEFD